MLTKHLSWVNLPENKYRVTFDSLFLNAKLEAKLRELSEEKEKVSVVKHMKGKERI